MSSGARPTRLRSLVQGVLALALAAAIWLPCVHFFYARPVDHLRTVAGVSPVARGLAAQQLHLWADGPSREREIRRMRVSNAEWDFMGRSFLVWSLANLSLREPAERARYLGVMDTIIDETLRIERDQGMYVFLMPYATARPYSAQPARSLFLDGEIALMLAARRLVEEKPAYRAPLEERTRFIVERIQGSPALVAESYPDECWLFDHVVALAALRAADALDGSDHSSLIRDWLTMARRRFIDGQSGLLISSVTRDGVHLDGPEGSTIWMVAHCLQVLDEDFAGDQYDRARRELGRTVLGFGFAREWPISWHGAMDIDSGAVIPGLEASAGASGMAVIGAAAFNDTKYLQALAAALDLAAFPTTIDGRLRYCASNQVGDAAMLYAATLGPLWERVKERRAP